MSIEDAKIYLYVRYRVRIADATIRRELRRRLGTTKSKHITKELLDNLVKEVCHGRIAKKGFELYVCASRKGGYYYKYQAIY